MFKLLQSKHAAREALQIIATHIQVLQMSKTMDAFWQSCQSILLDVQILQARQAANAFRQALQVVCSQAQPLQSGQAVKHPTQAADASLPHFLTHEIAADKFRRAAQIKGLCMRNLLRPITVPL